MAEVDIAKVMLGVAVWVGVAVFAVVMVASGGGLITGFVPVLVAVLAAWAIGERMVHPEEMN